MTTISDQSWRTETPGHKGWVRSARPTDPNKYFIVSADNHANEPGDYLRARIDKKYVDRLPRMHIDENGEAWVLTEGSRPYRYRKSNFDGDDQLRASAGADPAQRVKDQQADGIDIEIVYPNKGLYVFSTQDVEFSAAMCSAYNDWAFEAYSEYRDRIVPVACIATGNVELAIAEVNRAANMGFRALTIPVRPVYGPADADMVNYNDPSYDRLWAAIQDVDLPVSIHVSTGKDPRTARGNGGAVINYVVHSLHPAVEPVVLICASGILERFPRLRFATIEAGIGWVPWCLTAMDEGYLKHHMWVSPKMNELPSTYYRQNWFASFAEDRAGLELMGREGLDNNFMWGNDYPHHEGTWPHSHPAIERTMGGLTDQQRANVLGYNAAKFYGLQVPASKVR